MDASGPVGNEYTLRTSIRAKLVQGAKPHDFREQRLVLILGVSPEISTSGGYLKLNIGKLISNRH